MANLRQLYKKLQNAFQDDEGFFQRGRLTAKPLNRFIQRGQQGATRVRSMTAPPQIPQPVQQFARQNIQPRLMQASSFINRIPNLPTPQFRTTPQQTATPIGLLQQGVRYSTPRLINATKPYIANIPKTLSNPMKYAIKPFEKEMEEFDKSAIRMARGKATRQDEERMMNIGLNVGMMAPAVTKFVPKGAIGKVIKSKLPKQLEGLANHSQVVKEIGKKFSTVDDFRGYLTNLQVRIGSKKPLSAFDKGVYKMANDKNLIKQLNPERRTGEEVIEKIFNASKTTTPPLSPTLDVPPSQAQIGVKSGVGERVKASPEIIEGGLPTTQKTISQGQKPPPPQSPPSEFSSKKIIPEGEKERQFITTVREAEATAPKVAEQVQGTYRPTTNKEAVIFAKRTVKENYDFAKQRVFDEPLSLETNTIGQELMRTAQEQGRFNDAIEVAEHLAQKGTQTGQTVQAFSIWGKFTPEGMLKYLTREVNKANAKLGPLSKGVRRIFGKGKTNIDTNDAKAIDQFMRMANKSQTDEQSAYYVKKAMDVAAKKIPWGINDVIDTYRYNNMLSNPLTHLRNNVSNAIQTFITRPATLIAEGRPIQAVKYEINTLKAIPEALGAFRGSFKKGEQFRRLDVSLIEGEKQLRPPKIMGVWNIPSELMEGSDRFFRTLIKSGEIAIGKSAKEAEALAEYSLFRQGLHPKDQGIVLSKIDDFTRGIYQLRKVGLGWSIPFLQTPMNVAKAWIEYSPVGVITTIGTSAKRTQMAKAIVGSVATLVGVDLAMQGRTTWSAPTDPLAKKLFYDSGKKPYSVKIGNKWVPMQTFGVYALALGLPAAYKHYQEDAPSALSDDQWMKLARTTGGIATLWSNQTFVSGLGAFVKIAQGDQDYTVPKNIAFTLGQLKPMEGLIRYIATVVDPIFRQPKTFSQQMIADIPGLTKSLPAYETSTGGEARRNITNYIAPYAMGIETPESQSSAQLFEDRKQQLQKNKLVSEEKKALEGGTSAKTVGGTILYTDEDGEVKQLDINKYIGNPPSDPIQKAKWISNRKSAANKVYFSDLPMNQKKSAISKMGLSYSETEFGALASLDDTQQAEVLFGLLEDRKWDTKKMDIFIDKKVLTNNVVTKMADQGLITADEERTLKAYIKGRTTGGSGRGRKKKGISLKIAKVQPLKTTRIKLKLSSPPKAKPVKNTIKIGKSKSQTKFPKFKIARTKVRFSKSFALPS